MRGIDCTPAERQNWPASEQQRFRNVQAFFDAGAVSEFLFVRYDLPIKPWKKLIPDVPIYGGIECAEGGKRQQSLTAAGYRKAAQHLWSDGADAIYLFNFFTTMAYGGRGISYFLYWGPQSQGGLYQDGKPSPPARAAAALNAEIVRFGPALLALESTGVYHTAPLPMERTPFRRPRRCGFWDRANSSSASSSLAARRRPSWS